MRVGVPTEIKPDEYRVSLTPAGARELAEHGHEVLIQKGAGEGSAIPDEEYEAQGARILPDADAVWGEAELVLGVKEPQPEEYPRIRADHVLFTYLHLAPDPDLTKALVRLGRHLHRLRDRGGLPWPAAAAGPDERGGRARSPPRPARSCSSARWAAGACCSAACPAWPPPTCS